MANIVTVTNFELTLNGLPVTTVGVLTFLKVHLDYAGGPNGIHAGDTISVKIDNQANDILKIVGIGNNTVNIYGDEPIGKVGTRTYRNDYDGNFYLDVLFDNGYNDFYGGDQPSNITGWLETSVYVEYKKEVPEPGTTRNIEIYVNGVKIYKTVNVQPGGGTGPEQLDYAGSIIAKSWRYGDHSGNLGDLPEVEDNNYNDFELMRFSINVGYQNLTWRDLRGSNGTSYYTTNASLQYSNNNPTGNRYQSVNEPYLAPYAVQFGHHIDTPFHYKNVVVEDFLAIGKFNNVICSGHEYLKDSLRIIRIVGREVNNTWWGKYAFRVLADSNFLVHAPEEPIDRYLTSLFFKDYRGLTIDEFLQQMHSEGQLLDKHTADDILKFDHVNNSEAPFASDPDDTRQIEHFSLELGDLHFNDATSTVNLVGTDNNVIFSNVPSQNLPYAYWIYYDTKATEAILDNGFFYYVNAASFKYDSGQNDIGNISLWIKLEDGSGGAGNSTEVRIRKVDEAGLPIRNVKFILTKTTEIPYRIREAVTTINGNVSFTLGVGNYILEEVLEDGTLTPVAPMHFTITNTDELVNLRTLLEGTGYPNLEDIEFVQDLNIITNKTKVIHNPTSILLSACKRAVDAPLIKGQFEFGLFDENGTKIATTTNQAPST